MRVAKIAAADEKYYLIVTQNMGAMNDNPTTSALQQNMLKGLSQGRDVLLEVINEIDEHDHGR